MCSICSILRCRQQRRKTKHPLTNKNINNNNNNNRRTNKKRTAFRQASDTHNVQIHRSAENGYIDGPSAMHSEWKNSYFIGGRSAKSLHFRDKIITHAKNTEQQWKTERALNHQASIENTSIRFDIQCLWVVFVFPSDLLTHWRVAITLLLLSLTLSSPRPFHRFMICIVGCNFLPNFLPNFLLIICREWKWIVRQIWQTKHSIYSRAMCGITWLHFYPTSSSEATAKKNTYQ